MELTTFEKAVLEKLLYGEHPVLENLRFQLKQSRITSREFTGVGFFIHFGVDTKLVYEDVNFEIGDVDAKIDGVQYGVGFVLFIRQGRLFMLEGYTYDESWPENVTQYALYYMRPKTRQPLYGENIEQYTLSYESVDERDLTALFDKLIGCNVE